MAIDGFEIVGDRELKRDEEKQGRKERGFQLVRAEKGGGMLAGTLVSAVSTDKPKKLLDQVHDAWHLKPGVSSAFRQWLQRLC